MKTYIALIRGVNVGGKSMLPMRSLVAILENLDLRKVKTYLQSGNVVFQSEELAKKPGSKVPFPTL